MGDSTMTSPNINPEKLADIQTVADKLSNLPQDALIYISGAVDTALLLQQLEAKAS